MIDRRIGDKPIKFELSIGNYGNTIDGENVSVVQKGGDSDNEDEEDEEEEEKPSVDPEWVSTTVPVKPTTRDK